MTRPMSPAAARSSDQSWSSGSVEFDVVSFAPLCPLGWDAHGVGRSGVTAFAHRYEDWPLHVLAADDWDICWIWHEYLR